MHICVWYNYIYIHVATTCMAHIFANINKQFELMWNYHCTVCFWRCLFKIVALVLVFVLAFRVNTIQTQHQWVNVIGSILGSSLMLHKCLKCLVQAYFICYCIKEVAELGNCWIQISALSQIVLALRNKNMWE